MAQAETNADVMVEKTVGDCVYGAPYRKLRQAAEHRLARLIQLGVHQARYIGRTKTLRQLLMAATVANLTLVAIGTGLMRDQKHIKERICLTNSSY